MCFDANQLAAENRLLRGDFFTAYQSYFQVNLKRCVPLNKTKTFDISNMPEQKALELALAEISRMKWESEAFNNPKQFEQYSMKLSEIAKKKEDIKQL